MYIHVRSNKYFQYIIVEFAATNDLPFRVFDKKQQALQIS